MFICQAVDRDDPVLAGTLHWIEAFARQPSVDGVTVVALRTESHELPASVRVHRFGRSNRLATMAAFYRAVESSLHPRPDFFFVYQGGPYPLLLMPFKLIKRIPIVQWKAHPVISRMMAFQARWCDDLILTSASTAFPMKLTKVRVVGQGIDIERFRPGERSRTGHLIAACRIAPRKRIDQMIRALARANHRYGTEYTLDVYGPTLRGDEPYAATLQSLIEELGAGNWVKLHGPVAQSQLPALLNAHRASLNFSATAIDRSVIEGMACGLPVLSTNDSIAELLPADLHAILITDKESTELQASAIHTLLSRTEEELFPLRQRMRDLMVKEHSVDHLFDRILAEVRRLLWDRV